MQNSRRRDKANGSHLFDDSRESHYQSSDDWKKKDATKKLYQIRKPTMKQSNTISAQIAPGGGHGMWIRPQT